MPITLCATAAESPQARIVNVRFNGGAQAGHTVVLADGRAHIRFPRSALAAFVRVFVLCWRIRSSCTPGALLPRNGLAFEKRRGRDNAPPAHRWSLPRRYAVSSGLRASA